MTRLVEKVERNGICGRGTEGCVIGSGSPRTFVHSGQGGYGRGVRTLKKFFLLTAGITLCITSLIFIRPSRLFYLGSILETPIRHGYSMATRPKNSERNWVWHEKKDWNGPV